MAIVISMSDFEVDVDVESFDVDVDVEYEEEVLNAGWNPEVDSACEQLQFVPTGEQNAIPEDLTTVASELFLRKMYSYQR